jgi:GNAT superfamily N-acetyltransferase
VPELDIRPATSADRAGIKAVFKSHLRERDWKYAKRYFESYFDHPELHPHEEVFVAVKDGRVAGTIGYLRDRRGAPGIFWLGWYYVHAADRGGGLGKLLLDHVVQKVRALGARKLFTDTASSPFYERARRTYERLGFTEEGTLEDYYWDGEHQVFYAMDLIGDEGSAGGAGEGPS